MAGVRQAYPEVAVSVRTTQLAHRLLARKAAFVDELGRSGALFNSSCHWSKLAVVPVLSMSVLALLCNTVPKLYSTQAGGRHQLEQTAARARPGKMHLHGLARSMVHAVSS